MFRISGIRYTLFLCIVLLSGPVSATILQVPVQYSTIQGAMDAALVGDTVLVSPGTYEETIQFAGKSIALMSTAGAENTSIVAPSTLSKSVDEPDSTLLDDPLPVRVENFMQRGAGQAVLVDIGQDCDSRTVLAGFTLDGRDVAQGVRCMYSDAEIRECVVKNCYSDNIGGGIQIQDGAAWVHDNSIYDNEAYGMGGGIFIQPGYGNAEIRITGNSLWGNSSIDGAAIALWIGENVLIERNKIFGNYNRMNAQYRLAVLVAAAADISIINNTIFGNYGGIIYLAVDKLDLVNNIIATNIFLGIYNCADIGPSTDVYRDYNNVSGNAYNYFVSEPAGPHDVSSDPLFDPAFAGEFLLTEESPCIDAGNPDPAYNDPDGSRADIGAVPYATVPDPPLPVTRRVPSQYESIQDAIDAAGYRDTILVAPGTYTEKIDFSGKSIRLISESGPQVTTLMAPPDPVPAMSDILPPSDDTSSSPAAALDKTVLYLPVVLIPAGCDTSATIEGFTIDGGGIVQGIIIMSSDASISGNIIQNCRSYRNGGGICGANTRSRITGNEIGSNRGSFMGGGIYIDNDYLPSGDFYLSIESNTIHDNYAPLGPAITLESCYYATVARNIIYRHDAVPGYPAMGALYISYGLHSRILNNTIDACLRGMTLKSCSYSIIQNNLITRCAFGALETLGSPLTPGAVDYNAFWDNGGDIYIESAFPGDGDIVDDPDLDPGSLLGGYNLLAGSPCINAGNPDPQYNDPDGSRADIGAVPYVPVTAYTPVLRRVPSVYATIQAAIDAAWQGDTILVAAGEYVEDVWFQGKNIHVLSESGAENTIIKSPGDKSLSASPERLPLIRAVGGFDDFGIGDVDAESAAKVSHEDALSPVVYFDFGSDTRSTLAGFTIDGVSRAVCVASYGADPVIRDCIIENGQTPYPHDGAGVYGILSSPIVQNNIIRGNYTGAIGGAVSVVLRGGESETRISNNRIYGNYGLHYPAIAIASGKNVVIDHNLVYDNIDADMNNAGDIKVSAIYLYNVDTAAIINNTVADNMSGVFTYNCRWVDILNNIIADNVYAGLDIQDDEKDAQAYITHDYNLIWNNGYGNFLDFAIVSANEIIADPQFMPDYPGRYFLAIGSPAINAGHPDPQYNDPDGSRNDMGALPYRYMAPHTPLTLRVPYEYATIQAAIDAATDGDTVLVGPGTYTEFLCLEGKSIILRSESGPEVTAVEFPGFGATSSLCRPEDAGFLLSGADKEILPSELTDSMPVITIIPGSDRTTTISGFRIDGRGEAPGILCIGADITVSNCIVEYCRCSRNGAGMQFYYAKPRLYDNIVRHNFALIYGGGIAMQMGYRSDTAFVTGNRIYDNTSAQYSGLAILDGDNAVIEHNLIYANLDHDSYNIGAVYCRGTNIALRNNTIVGNYFGVRCDSVVNFDFRNNLIAYNINAGAAIYGDYSQMTIDYNLYWFNGLSDYYNTFAEGPNDISADPLFAARHSGEYYLSASSAAIDAGDPDPLFNDTDGSRNDIGARMFEAVSFPAPSLRAVPSVYPTIQAAVDSAFDGDTILVAPGEYVERIDFCGKSLTLLSEEGSERTVVRAPEVRRFCNPEEITTLEDFSGKSLSDAGEKYWVYPYCPSLPAGVVVLTPGSDNSTEIAGFRFDGNHEHPVMYCGGTGAEIHDCIIENGNADDGGGAGGGIIIRNGGPYIHDNEIRFNAASAGYGGALYAYMWTTVANRTFGSPRIENNFIHDNYAKYVGAMYVYQSGNADTVFIIRNTIADNTTRAESSHPSAVAMNSTPWVFFFNNTVAGNSGGIEVTNSASIRNNIIANNAYTALTVTNSLMARDDYNDIWGNGDNSSSSNFWGNHGISVDPLFDPYAVGQYLLSEASPCIDAGDPDPAFNDTDGSRNDMGAVPYAPGPPHDPITIHVPLDYTTIQAAIDVAGYGDTVMVAPGLYQELVDFRNKSIKLLAEDKADVTIIRAPAEKATTPIDPDVISPDRAIPVGLPDSTDSDKVGPVLRVVYIGTGCDSTTELHGFTIDGDHRMGCMQSYGSNADIGGCIIENGYSILVGGGYWWSYTYYEYGSGLRVQGGAPNIHDNIFHGNTVTSPLAIYPTPGGSPHVRVSGNEFYANDTRPMYSLLIGGGAGVDITHNIVREERTEEGIGDDGHWAIFVDADSVAVINNTIVRCDRGIKVNGGVGVNVRNNIIAFNDVGGLVVNDTAGVVCDYNLFYKNSVADTAGPMLYGSHNVSASPQFSPYDPDFYHISGTSPCIDAGDPNPAYDDADGTVADIGATYYAHGAATHRVPVEYSQIQQAIDVSHSGDTILVGAGTYEEYLDFEGKQICLRSTSGASSTVVRAPAAKESDAAEAVITIGECPRPGTVISGLTIDGNNRVIGLLCTGANVTVTECMITRGYTWYNGGGASFTGCAPVMENNVIRNCFAGTSAAGIYINLSGADTTAIIRGNYIYDNSGTDFPALRIIGGLGAIVERNVVYNNISNAPTDNKAAVCISTSNFNLRNNTVAANTAGIYVGALAAVDVRNNIIVNNPSGGVRLTTIQSGDDTRTVDYNDVWNNGGSDYLDAAVPGGNDLAADPKFKNPGDGNYHLAVSSPCIDAGDPDPVYNDSDGSRCDIGALSFGGLICGDVSGDGTVDIGDAVFLINYIFRSGPAPDPLAYGDVSGDGEIDIGDAVYLIKYIFSGGPEPVCP